ncbi:MAG: metalloregulator ArsR/SmtB family transcription factor, partial [Oscillospiraceae bacterium]|nr:metalloregulator ArsR/SmtB family transcription factor [Oscillospiraceae bacterium]
MDTVSALKALADENRMLILRLLLRRSCCVRALARQLDISEAAVSQHLKVLREAGVILGEKHGYFMHYTVNRSALQELADILSSMATAAAGLPCTPQHGGCTQAEYEKCRHAGETAYPVTSGHDQWKGKSKMKIAVTYQNGMVFQHFGHCEAFKFYTVENNKVVSAEVISANGSGHGALAGFLKQNGADALICGGIGGGARTALAAAGIELFPGTTGST